MTCGGGAIPKQLRVALGRQVLRWAVIAISLIVILAPSVLGLMLTIGNFNRQMTDYRDDGHRYIIADSVATGFPEDSPVSKHWDLLMLLTDHLATSDHAPLSGSDSYRTTVAGWMQQAELWGWTAAIVAEREPGNLVMSHADVAYIALLNRSGVPVPVLIVDTDGIFVTAYEANTGKVLYRRIAFETAWSGLALAIQSPEARSHP